MSLALARPESEDALAALVAGEAALQPIAGGTDLLIAPGHLRPDGVVVDLTRLAAWAEITSDDKGLFVGATVTVARLACDADVRRLCPALAQAAEAFGSVQIRNRATIGGNIANASAAADLAPPLVAAAAEAVLLSPAGCHVVPVDELMARRPVLAPRTLIKGFRLAAGRAGPAGAFVKLGRRREPVISRLTLAAAGPAGDLRLVAGAIGTVPRRLEDAERTLNTASDRFAASLPAEVLAAIPGRASARYKARAIRGLGLDLMAALGLVSGDPS